MIMTVSSAKQVHQLKYHLGLKELCISWRRESLPTQMSILGVISEPAQLRPGPSAVRNQRCCAPDSWRAAPQPHHSAPRIPPLAAHTSVHPVQAVRTGLPVRSGVRTELPAECHLPGRECGITASPAFRVIGRSHRAGDATYNNGRWRLRHCSTVHLEQSTGTGRDPSQPISGYHQTFTENSLLYSMFLLTLLITFSPRTVKL